MTTFEFDEAQRATPAGEGRWRATVTDRWDIGAGRPNGGYLLALALSPVASAVGLPDPFTATAHYFRPPRHGPVDLDVEVVRRGRRHATAMVRMSQEGGEVVRVLTTFGDLDAREGPTHVTGERPPYPPPDECLPRDALGPPPFPIEFIERFDARIAPSTMEHRHRHVPDIGGWMRLADGRDPDPLLLPVIADGFPPAIFSVIQPGWLPTLELTVHVRQRPAPGWLACRFTTRFLLDGYAEEDGEVWDSEGRLVAQSRQLALVLPAPPSG